MTDASSIFRRRRPRPEGETTGAQSSATDKPYSGGFAADPLRGTPDARATRPIIQVPTRRANDASGANPVPAVIPAAQPDEARLIVGRNIRFKGEIAACDVLVVEGEVEASITCRLIEVAKNGVFRGHAEVETAEIHGRVDGELTAKKLLRVMGSGRVEGRIRYATIEVASGGQLGGDIGNVAIEAPRSNVTGLPGAIDITPPLSNVG